MYWYYYINPPSGLVLLQQSTVGIGIITIFHLQYWYYHNNQQLVLVLWQQSIISIGIIKTIHRQYWYYYNIPPSVMRSLVMN